MHELTNDEDDGFILDDLVGVSKLEFQPHLVELPEETEEEQV